MRNGGRPLASIQDYYLISGSLKVEESLANKHTPTSFRMPVLHFDDPSFESGFLIIAAEQQSRRIASHHILQDANPLFDSG